MKCANPLCEHRLHYLRGGTLRLLEFENALENRLRGGGGGFPVIQRSARYFWLCSECSGILILRSWTQYGLVLQSRRQPEEASPRTWTVPAEPAVDVENRGSFRIPRVRTA
jgi:hypothetical protein